MKVITGPRQCGKTTMLIQESAATGVPIVCLDALRREQVMRLARQLGYEIPIPMTVSEQTTNGYAEEVLVDDTDVILQHTLHARINTVVLNQEELR